MKQRNEFRSPLKATGENIQSKAQLKKPAPIAAERAAPPASDSAHERQRRIAEAAYYRALARGFEPGNEVDDWIQAEAEIDRASTRG